MNENERIIETSLQEAVVLKRNISGSVLDIGGGGEGIIGLVYGKNAVVIDNRPEELDETDNDAVKILMDACELAFPDNSFELVTFFYSLMYMDMASKNAAIKEAVRVLQKGGLLEIWDTSLPECDGNKKDIFIANVAVNANGKVIKTGYGVGIENMGHTPESIRSLLVDNKMTIEILETGEDAFHIVAGKPF